MVSIILPILWALCQVYSMPTDEKVLWAAFDNPQIGFEEAMTAANQLRILHGKTGDQNVKNAVKKVIDKISSIFKREFELAGKHYESGNYSRAAAIMSTLIEHDSGLLDKKSKLLCLSKLLSYRYREALIGEYDWRNLVEDISAAKDLNEIESDFSYHKEMGQANVINKQSELSHPEILEHMEDPLARSPYVLRFEIPQYGQTPSVAHFGHVSTLPTLPICTLS